MPSEGGGWPNFFIVGAAKSGTTSLAAYLAQHPQIGFPDEKEPNYFALCGRDLHRMPGPASGEQLFGLLYGWSVTNARDYRACFAPVESRPRRGDASVRYLYCREAPERIRKLAPDAKIIILLRNPVDRLWSHYTMMRTRYHLEPEKLRRALALEPRRMAAGWDYDWHYVAAGRYAGQIARYLETFGPGNVFVEYYEQFAADTRSVTLRIIDFLGLPQGPSYDLSRRSMVGYGLRWPWLDRLFSYPHACQPLLNAIFGSYRKSLERRINSWNRISAPTLPDALRRELRVLFADEFPDLARQVGRPVPSSW